VIRGGDFVGGLKAKKNKCYVGKFFKKWAVGEAKKNKRLFPWGPGK